MKTPEYDFKDYKITYNINLLDEQNHMTPELHRITEEIRLDAMKGRKYLIKKLNRLIEKYPKVPIFKNFLSIVYLENDLTEKVYETNLWIFKEHPDYLFGKLNFVADLLDREEFVKIPEILGKDMELHLLYPERNEFHAEEFISFNQTAALYFLSQENFEQANTRLEMMQKVDPEHIKTKYVIEKMTHFLFVKFTEDKHTEMENRIEVKEADRRSHLQTTKAPTFNFPLQMQWVYEEDESFPKEKIEKILQLDQEELIEDLEKALEDSVLRFDYFLERQDEDYEPLNIPVNAILLLIELKSEKSLKNILELLKQDEDFINYWFGEYFSEVIDATIYGLGRNQIDLFLDFLKLPNVNGFNKAEVSNGIKTLVEKFPKRREEFLTAYQEILEFFIENAENPAIADTYAYSLVVFNVTDAGFKELLPQIKQLFEIGLIEENMRGGYDEIATDIQERDITIVVQEFVEGSIFEKFEILQEIAEEDFRQLEEEDDLWAGDDFGEDDEFRHYRGERKMDDDALDDNSKVYDWSDKKPFVKPKEPGRNDPCPCGSGKKYKKCCLNK